MTLKSLGCIKSFEDSWPSTFTYIPSLPYFGDLVKSFIKLPWGISKEPIFYGDPSFFQSPIFLVSRYFFITFLLLWTCEILLPAFHFIGRIYTATIILHFSTEKLIYSKETSNWNISLFIEIIARYLLLAKKTIILISHENNFDIISINLKVL